MEILTRRLLPAALLAAALAPAARAAGGAITLIPNGAVDARPIGGAAPWRQVVGSESVAAGTEVRTHRSSTAELVFSDGSRVEINSFSIFAIDKTSPQESGFSLKIGKIRAAFAGLLSSRISIRTPTAVCAVRGTVFEIGADEKNTDVTMAEGVLEVKDNSGKEAVITSEETMKIGENGLERPRMLSLSDSRSLTAVRPYNVHQEMARESRRTMVEDLRNRELKANEAQLGKDVIDAYGQRVRIEEYVLRPSANSFELLFMNQRAGSFNWGHYVQTFAAPIPDDLSQAASIAAGGINAVNQPTNWLKSIEFYATNTIDAEKELFSYGDPVQINFAGFGKGLLWYPSTLVETQTLSGPGVPGGSRIQYQQTTSFNQSTNLFTWTQAAQTTPGSNSLSIYFAGLLNPSDASTNSSDPTSAGNGGEKFILNPVAYNAITTTQLTPSGPDKADIFQSTLYPDGSTLSVEKFLINNAGDILSFDPNSPIFSQNGDYNEEIHIGSNLFQGRAIDVLLTPSIFQQTGQAATTPDNLK